MSSKLTASSPLNDEQDKQLFLQQVDSSFLDSESDPDATIINIDVLSSSAMDSSPIKTFTEAAKTVKDEIRAALVDPEVIKLFTKSIAVEVKSTLVREISALKERLGERDKEILYLKEKVDELEQYSRRNSIRVSGVPECEGENTDEITKKIASEIGVVVDSSMIDRSHRVGKKPSGSEPGNRAIVVKFTSYRHKQQLLVAKKKLTRVNARTLVSMPAPSTAAAAVRAPAPRIYINDDLTKTRADIAAAARASKKKGKVTDTWTRDGAIFVKIGDTVHRVTNKGQLDALI
ncbi:hypothetical protein ACOMHN_020136 [Nucella lapillus]